MRMKIEIGGGEAFERKLRRHPDRIAKVAEGALKQAGRMLSHRYAESTQPVGMGDKGADKARQQVEWDVSRLFPSREQPWRIYEYLKKIDVRLAAAWQRAVKTGDADLMQKLLRRRVVKKGLDAAAHQAARVGARVPANAAALSVVAPGRQRAYIRRVQKRVGLAKAGWYVAAMSLGGRMRTRDVVTGKSVNKFPGYVRKLKSAASSMGGAKFRGGAVAYVVIWNRVPYILVALNRSGAEFALRAAEADYRKSLKKRIEAENRRRFRHVRRR